MTETLAHQINQAALNMANELGTDHETCKRCILSFVGAKDEAQLYNLVLSDAGTAETRGVRHVLRNARNVTLIDLADALTMLAGLAFIKDNVDRLLSIIAGGLFLVRTVRKATKVELSTADASVVWALHELGGSATKETLLDAWRDVVGRSHIVDATITPEKLDLRLRHLTELQCVVERGGFVLFAEPIEVDG